MEDAFWVFLIAGCIIMWALAWNEIFVKTGFNRWLIILMIIPVVNIVTSLWFAYSKWPVYEFVSKDWDVKRLKDKQKQIGKQIEELETLKKTKNSK